MLVPRAVPAWSGATRCARGFAVIRGSSRLLQAPDIDISHAVPLRCSTGPHCEAGDEAELSGMGHWSVQSRRGGECKVFCLGHFVAIRYQDKLYVSSADSEINLAQERIGTVLKYLSCLLFFTLH